MTSDDPVQVLDALETFVGQVHCAGAGAGLESLMDTDLSFSQIRSMLMLSQEPGPTPIHEVAEKLRLSVAATGRNLDRLVRDGFVDRTEDEFDRRIKRISLTGSGRDLINGFHQHQRAQALSFITGLAAADRQRLLAALRPINSRIAGQSVPATIASGSTGPTPETQQTAGYQPPTPQEQSR